MVNNRAYLPATNDDPRSADGEDPIVAGKVEGDLEERHLFDVAIEEEANPGFANVAKPCVVDAIGQCDLKSEIGRDA